LEIKTFKSNVKVCPIYI